MGEKWLSTYFKDHSPKAIEQAQQNSKDFLSELAQRVKVLEKQGVQSKKTIEESMDQPDFSVLLQKAMISSAQTKAKQKHRILARIVADRLAQDPESLLTLCSQQAADVIPQLNSRQMKILAFITAVFLVRPQEFPPPGVATHDTVLNLWYRQWLTEQLGTYQDLTVHNIDYLHLESLSCIKWDPIVSRNLEKALYSKLRYEFQFDMKAFLNTPLGSKINELWKGGLKSVLPTTVGQVIGIYTADSLTGRTTSLDGFGQF